MFRLNVHLADSIAERLNNFSAKSGQTKVAITSAALDEYLRKQEMQDALLEKLKDPEVMAKMCAAVGFNFDDLMDK